MNDLTRLSGYRMPAEWEQHDGCIMIWPVRPGSWPYGAVAARKAFCAVARAIGESEQVYMLAGAKNIESARIQTADIPNVTVVEIESDDAWARDVGPTYVVNGADRIGINWEFNAWGGEYDGLYEEWSRDDKVAGEFCSIHDDVCFDAHPFVLEGGSIHSDGCGTILTTEACLLSPGRNPKLSRNQIENILLNSLGAKRVVWLPCGIYNDETNEHVDNICAFVEPGKVVLAWTDDVNDPQYAMSVACEKVLIESGITVVRLPIPKTPILVQEEDLLGYEFTPGEDVREVGERLAASYVNFYISNGGVVVPQFGDENDAMAINILAECFPGRTIYPIQARDILVGGGNIHCITQQIPSKGV